MLKDEQLLDKIFTISTVKGKTCKKKCPTTLKKKWAKDMNRQFGEKEIQITQMYEKTFNITHNNK